MPIDCASTGVITFRGLMKSPLHNVKRPDSRSDKSGPMLSPGYGPRILSVSVLSRSLAAIPLASGRGQEVATSLSGPSFVPDGSSSTLAGWHTLGPAAWRADLGEIVGKGTGGSGWLRLDHSFQDTGLYASFQCTGTCDTGVLLRLQQTPEGMHGPAVLNWYKTVRNPKAPGGAELVPHSIHNRSGAGSDVLAVDLNGDGRMDIVTSTRNGTYIFWGRPAD
jgi:hypothetical protein